MRTELVSAKELSGELVQAWSALRDGNDALASPYFSPEFARLVGEVRDDAFVLVCEDAGRITALLPFQRLVSRIGGPLGGPMSDYQGVISESSRLWSPVALLRAARLDVLRFDHWHGSQAVMETFATSHARSPVMDLAGGFPAYERALRARGGTLLGSVRRHARKLERELGPLRFEAQVDDAAVLEQVLAWKTEQSERTGSPKLFAHRWARELVGRVHAARTPGFAGMLSALWAGDQLVAAHFGMRSHSVWHYWFPAYDRALSKFGPGLVLLECMARAASSLGLRSIDLGKGEQPYKSSLATAEVPLLEGRVLSTLLAVQAIAWVERSADRLRQTPLVVPARYPARIARRFASWATHR